MTFDPGLYQQSRAPIYLQVARLLRLRIEHGEWRIGERIPTLEKLMATYGVARSTLREALAQLEGEGVIRRSRGSGTFVTKDLSTQRWFKLATDWTELLASISDLRVRRLPIGRASGGALPPQIDFIDAEPADAYRHLRRVHFRQDVAYCLIDIWLERDVFNQDPHAFTKAPVLTRLSTLPDTSIAAAKQLVRVTVSDADTAAYLKIGVGDPIADVRRAIADMDGRIIYYAHIRYPAQLIEIDIDLLRGTTHRRAHKNKLGVVSMTGAAREENAHGRRKGFAARR